MLPAVIPALDSFWHSTIPIISFSDFYTYSIQLSKDTVQLAKITDSSLKKLNQQSVGMGQVQHSSRGT